MNDIRFFEEVFEPDFCRFLLNNARQSLSSEEGFTRSNQGWEPDLVQSSEIVHVRDYEAVLAEIILTKLQARGIIAHTNYAVMNYAWSQLSYIPWHRDPHSETAVTIYLNEEWNDDWGGLFLHRLERGDEIRGIAPRFNCAIRNTGNLLHATSLISSAAEEPRFTIQMFSKKRHKDT